MPIYRINDKLCLFIHIPKTGGTTIEKWLKKHASEAFMSPVKEDFFPCTPQHFHSEILQHLFSPDHFDYVFTVCRNPLERLLSEYRYRMEFQKKEEKPITSFRKWFKSNKIKYERNKFHLDNHLRPQHEFLSFDCTTYKFEDGINNIINIVADKLGIPGPENKYHENKRPDIPVTLENDLLVEINKLYKEDIELFEYTAPGYAANTELKAAMSPPAPENLTFRLKHYAEGLFRQVRLFKRRKY